VAIFCVNQNLEDSQRSIFDYKMKRSKASIQGGRRRSGKNDLKAELSESGQWQNFIRFFVGPFQGGLLCV
jgi:hypothetical protein